LEARIGVEPTEEFVYFEVALARSIDLHDVTTLIRKQGMRPEEVIEIEKQNVDLVARTLRIPKGKTKAAKRTLRLTLESVEVLKRRLHEGQQSDANLKALWQRIAKKLKVDPEKIAERERRKGAFVFPARRSGKRGKGHISLSGLENCHNDVLAALQEKGQTIPFVMYDLRHTFATRASENGMPLPTLASILDIPRCDKFKSTCIPHTIIRQPRWTALTKSRRNGSENTLSCCVLRPTAGPRQSGIRGI
jgi:integrase